MICIFEDKHVYPLRPLVDTRAVYQLRIGQKRIMDYILAAFGNPEFSLHSRPLVFPALQSLEPGHVPAKEDQPMIFVNGRILFKAGASLGPISRLLEEEKEKVLVQGNMVIAARIHQGASRLIQQDTLGFEHFAHLEKESVSGFMLVQRLWHLLDEIGPFIRTDAEFLKEKFKPLSHFHPSLYAGAIVRCPESIFVADDVRIGPGAILNAESGPIILDSKATVMDAAVIRGATYVGPHATVNPQASISNTVIGPWCKVGGEVASTIFQSYSNKGHDGFVGNSFIGSWCNLGANTITSNLRNDYGEVSQPNFENGLMEKTGRQFLGLVLGDHTKTGIGTLFNSGSVVGVNCNVYGEGFQPRYIPSFTWGGAASGFVSYRIDKALEVARAMMKRRKQSLSEAEQAILVSLYQESLEATLRVPGHLGTE